MSGLEELRIVNAALALATLGAWLVRFNYRWADFLPGRRIVWVGISLLLGAVAYGSAESYVLGAPIGARSVFVSVALAVLLTGLWRSRDDES